MKLKTIYVPRGRAREYSSLGLNLYNGCSFECDYCSVPRTLDKEKDVFHALVTERENLLLKIESDCRKLEGSTEKVLLCFSSDPYNDLDLELELTRKSLELFKKYNINFQILTKGGLRAERDFDLYKPGDAFASTLTFADDSKSILWEKNAPLPSSRIEALKKAHSMGIETWVSLEPVIDPEESLAIIEKTHEFVDLFKVGVLNYHELSETIDWKSFGERAIELLEKLGKSYYIKDDLKKHLS